MKVDPGEPGPAGAITVTPRHQETGRQALAALLATWLAACADSGATTLESSRTYEPIGREIRWGASDAERFGISARDFASRGAGGPQTAPRPSFELPAGWSELPPATMREVNLRVGGDARAECYLTTLAGEAGGLVGNVNRWRSQLSQPSLSPEEVAALPRVPWLGGTAVLVDVEGDWTGMSGEDAQARWRLVGLLLVATPQSRFLKMVGPAEVIARERAAFDTLVASFRLPGEAAPAPAAESMASSIAWTAPRGWQRAADKAMREVTFAAGARGEVECYVALLAGDGGGLAANVERWCQQLGAEPPSADELAALPREPVLGGEGVVVEIARGAQASAPAGQELLLGALLIRSDRSLFVKMTGPRAAVEAERAAFLEFCRSLRSRG
jgi:hypothetical protein